METSGEGWVPVFLGVMAVGALLQAAVLGALALATRRLERSLESLEARLGEDVLPALARAARAAREAARASEGAVRDFHVVDGLVHDATARASRLVDRASLVTVGVAGGASLAARHGLERSLAAGAGGVRRRAATAWALARALRTGYRAWRALRGA